MAKTQGKKKKASAPDGFATRLRELRRQRNLSQSEMSSRSGIHVIHYGRYERGEARPTVDSLKRIADVLNVPADYLMQGATDEAAKSRLQDRDLLRQFQEVEKLPDDDKVVIKKFLDAFLMKKKLEELTAQRTA